MQKQKPKATGRKQLTIILIVATISLMGSYGLFWLAKGGVGWGTTNNGEFVTPLTHRRDLGCHFLAANEGRRVLLLSIVDASMDGGEHLLVPRVKLSFKLNPLAFRECRHLVLHDVGE